MWCRSIIGRALPDAFFIRNMSEMQGPFLEGAMIPAASRLTTAWSIAGDFRVDRLLRVDFVVRNILAPSLTLLKNLPKGK